MLFRTLVLSCTFIHTNTFSGMTHLLLCSSQDVHTAEVVCVIGLNCRKNNNKKNMTNYFVNVFYNNLSPYS